MPDILVLIIILAVLFDVANGWHDCANAIATVVSTKVLSPTAAVVLAAFMNILGAFLSTAVAKTIGKGVIEVYIPLLYLMSEGKLALWQEEFFGEVLVQACSAEAV